MSTERDAWDLVDKLWVWLTATGTLVAMLGFVFREFLSGLLGKIGEWVATNLLNKKKVEHIKEKVVKADGRGKLHNFLAEELYKVNKRLDACETRHKERDRRDDEREKKLSECHKRREELEIKAVRFANETRLAAVENGNLLSELTRLKGRPERG